METTLRRVTGQGLLALQDCDLRVRKGRTRGATERRREELAASLPSVLHQRYERLRERAQPPWVFRLADGACPRCRMTLPLQQVQDARAWGEIIVCDHCLRLLIGDPLPTAT